MKKMKKKIFGLYRYSYIIMNENTKDELIKIKMLCNEAMRYNKHELSYNKQWWIELYNFLMIYENSEDFNTLLLTLAKDCIWQSYKNRCICYDVQNNNICDPRYEILAKLRKNKQLFL